MNSYKGKILISTPDLSGDIFSRSVVLITEHNEFGAFGLILNKKNEDASINLQKIFGFAVEVYDGGPVEKNRVIFIIKGDAADNAAFIIDENYYITEDMDFVVAAVINGDVPLEDVKIFSGYSGWTSEQLENEIRQKFWTPIEIEKLDYTLPNDQNLWKNIMLHLGGEFLLWANAPENILLN